MRPGLEGASHIALTVTDMETSATWYQALFGWEIFQRLGSDEAGSPRIILVDRTNLFIVALCQPETVAGHQFDHRRIGLDHFAFKVADQVELDRWMQHLSDRGVPHSPVRVLDLGRFVSFEDPDGIQFELWVNDF